MTLEFQRLGLFKIFLCVRWQTYAGEENWCILIILLSKGSHPFTANDKRWAYHPTNPPLNVKDEIPIYFTFTGFNDSFMYVMLNQYSWSFPVCALARRPPLLLTPEDMLGHQKRSREDHVHIPLPPLSPTLQHVSSTCKQWLMLCLFAFPTNVLFKWL